MNYTGFAFQFQSKFNMFVSSQLQIWRNKVNKLQIVAHFNAPSLKKFFLMMEHDENEHQ